MRCGADTFETVCLLVAPKTPGEVSFNDLVTLLRRHFDPLAVRPLQLVCFKDATEASQVDQQLLCSPQKLDSRQTLECC